MCMYLIVLMSSFQAKVTGSKSENFEEVLSNTANAEKEESQPLPEEKVPMWGQGQGHD